MFKRNDLNRDSATLGLILSVAVPFILFLTVFFIKYHEYNHLAMFKLPVGKNIPKIFSVCVFPNGLIFYFFVVRNRLKTMRGMLIGTVIMAAIMGILFLITGF